jgi:dnd system-associated protein 4
MKNIFDFFARKTPHYPNAFKDMVDTMSRKRAFDSSIGTEKEKSSQGKLFSSYYQCYMYATILGMRLKYRIPFDRAAGTKFIEIDAWRPRDMTRYIFMGLLALSDINLIDLEGLTDDQSDAKAFELMRLMEEYAHGGFDIMRSKLKEDKYYFDHSHSIIHFLQEVESFSASA